MLSTLVFITLLPLQAGPSAQSSALVSKPLAVAAFVDSAKILGLPKFKLRDDRGNLYFRHKAMMQESLALINLHAGIPNVNEISTRKAYIASYVRR